MPSAADLQRAVVRRSLAYASRVAESYAAGNRTYRVEVSRPGEQPRFDRATATWTNPSDLVLYEGPARVYSVGGSGSLAVGDEPTYYAATRISLDPYTGTQPRRDDLVRILDDGQGGRSGLTGRTFRVEDVETGGMFALGPTLSVSGVAPSRQQT